MAQSNPVGDVIQWGVILVIGLLFGPKLFAMITSAVGSLSSPFGASVADYNKGFQAALDSVGNGYAGPYSPEYYASNAATEGDPGSGS
jgi:hypothetical protein